MTDTRGVLTTNKGTDDVDRRRIWNDSAAQDLATVGGRAVAGSQSHPPAYSSTADVLREMQLSKSHGKKILLMVVLALVGSALVFMNWYRSHYSMGVARGFEVAGSPAAPRILIATQESTFKDALTAGLVEHLRHRSAHITVIDVSRLEGVQPTDWDAIVVIHTWEMHKAPTVVRTFVKRLQVKDKLVVLTTSGAGAFKLAEVDAISAASRMSDVSAKVNEMAVRIDAIVERASSPSESLQ